MRLLRAVVRLEVTGMRLLEVHARTARIFLRDAWWFARRNSFY